MTLKTLTLTTALLGLAAGPAMSQSRVDQIIDRLTNANDNRDHVMVVAHRGSWWKDGRVELAENSLSAIDRAVEIGAEMVELDVQKTADNRYVILHDETLDRTTTCTGAVAEKTLADLADCRLVVGRYHGPNDEVLGVGVETDEALPTLEQAYESINGRVLMNVDIKLGVEELVNVIQMADDMGVARQIVIKARTGNPEEIEAARATLDRIEADTIFMPILDDRDVSTIEAIDATYDTFSPEAIEVLNRWEPGTPLTDDGGIMVSMPARALATQNDTHLWINTLWQGANARISGGRGDPIAVGPGLTDEGWGFWVDAGATIFQTDEPEALIAYLQENGYRRDYQAVSN